MFDVIWLSLGCRVFVVVCLCGWFALGYSGLVGCFVLDCEFAAGAWVVCFAFIGGGDCLLVCSGFLCVWVVWVVFRGFDFVVDLMLVGLLFGVWFG